MPSLVLSMRPQAQRPAVLDDLLALADAGQQQAVDAAVFQQGAESRFAKKLQGLPIWELRTQARGGAKGGMRVSFYFQPDGSAVIINAETKTGNTPGAALTEALRAWKAATLSGR